MRDLKNYKSSIIFLFLGALLSFLAILGSLLSRYYYPLSYLSFLSLIGIVFYLISFIQLKKADNYFKRGIYIILIEILLIVVSIVLTRISTSNDISYMKYITLSINSIISVCDIFMVIFAIKGYENITYYFDRNINNTIIKIAIFSYPIIMGVSIVINILLTTVFYSNNTMQNIYNIALIVLATLSYASFISFIINAYISIRKQIK